LSMRNVACRSCRRVATRAARRRAKASASNGDWDVFYGAWMKMVVLCWSCWNWQKPMPVDVLLAAPWALQIFHAMSKDILGLVTVRSVFIVSPCTLKSCRKREGSNQLPVILISSQSYFNQHCQNRWRTIGKHILQLKQGLPTDGTMQWQPLQVH
jgi:hypothetical protein